MSDTTSIQAPIEDIDIPAIVPIGSAQPVSKTLPDAVKRIAKELQPDKIILFGSYARGTATPDSDVDLLVILDTTQPARDRFLDVARLLRPRLFPVDILVKTPQEIAQALEEGNFFFKEIILQGKVLYERPTNNELTSTPSNATMPLTSSIPSDFERGE